MNSISLAQPPPIQLRPLPTVNGITISKQYETFGHAPLKVLCDDGSLYVVKNAGPRVPPCVLISEFLGHFLLRIWGLPTPAAAIVNIPPEYIFNYKLNVPGELSNILHQPRFYEKSCFGSRIIPNIVEVGPIHQTSRTNEWRKTTNFMDLLLLTLFDIWTENDDRRPGNPNLILRPVSKNKFRWYAIDHAFCFSTLDFNQLDPSGVSSSYNDSLLYAPMMAGLKRLLRQIPNWAQVITQAFYQRVQLCCEQFNQISSIIPTDLAFSPSLQTNVADFLFSEERNKMVLDEYFSRF